MGMATILIFGEDLPSATTTGLGSSLDKYGEGKGWIPREESEEMWIKHIGVRDGGGGAAAPPPIRGVCRPEFGQRVDIIRAKHNTCLNNTNLGPVTGVNGRKHEFRVCYCSYRKKSCHPQNMDPGKFQPLPPPPH